MKKVIIGAVMALWCLSAQAAKLEPFAYADGIMDNGRAYLYRAKCPAQHADDWSYAQIEVDDGNGGDVGYACWMKVKNPDQKAYPGYSVRICDLGSTRWIKSENLAKYDFAKDHLNCGSVDADQVYKWSPRPKASL